MPEIFDKFNENEKFIKLDQKIPHLIYVSDFATNSDESGDEFSVLSSSRTQYETSIPISLDATRSI